LADAPLAADFSAPLLGVLYFVFGFAQLACKAGSVSAVSAASEFSCCCI